MFSSRSCIWDNEQTSIHGRLVTGSEKEDSMLTYGSVLSRDGTLRRNLSQWTINVNHLVDADFKEDMEYGSRRIDGCLKLKDQDLRGKG